jgi:hypothetical protein
MEGLVEAGFVLLGGPLEGDREVLLIVSAPGEDAIRQRLAADPWLQDGTLSIVSIERWAILLDGLHPAVGTRSAGEAGQA